MLDIRATDDFATLRRLAIDAGLEPAERSDVERLGLWAARDGDRIVGGVALERIDGLHVVTWLWVAAEHRRQGVATALLAALQSFARDARIATLWATARAPHFFLARGFSVAPPGRERDLLLGPCDGCPQRNATCTPEAVVRR